MHTALPSAVATALLCPLRVTVATVSFAKGGLRQWKRKSGNTKHQKLPANATVLQMNGCLAV